MDATPKQSKDAVDLADRIGEATIDLINTYIHDATDSVTVDLGLQFFAAGLAREATYQASDKTASAPPWDAVGDHIEKTGKEFDACRKQVPPEKK